MVSKRVDRTCFNPPCDLLSLFILLFHIYFIIYMVSEQVDWTCFNSSSVSSLLVYNLIWFPHSCQLTNFSQKKTHFSIFSVNPSLLTFFFSSQSYWFVLSNTLWLLMSIYNHEYESRFKTWWLLSCTPAQFILKIK